MRFARPFLALVLASALGAQAMRPRALRPATHRVSAAPGPVASAPETSSDTVLALPTLETAAVAPLRTAPDGPPRATVERGAPVVPLAHEGAWVRVRIEGWMRDRELAPVNDSAVTALSAADLRADPGGTRGRSVRWNVEFLALQSADQLRRDMVPDEPYILARGPGAENALLYLTVPPSLLDAAHALPPLAPLIITARVRVGRSDPTGVPILDLVTLARRSR